MISVLGHKYSCQAGLRLAWHIFLFARIVMLLGSGLLAIKGSWFDGMA
jgi:hypothetical protein